MISECKQFLIEELKKAGIKSQIHVAEKTLKISSESHIGAVLFQGDNFTRNGSKRQIETESGKVLRVKRLDRDIRFSVIIGDYNEDAVERTFDTFISNLPDGIDVMGNYVEIEISDADWVPKEDSVLKSKLSVQIQITFKGGVYSDRILTKLNCQINQTLV